MMIPKWLPLQDAIELFSKHESYADISEEKRGSYRREYIALKEYMNLASESSERQIFKRFPGVSCAYCTGNAKTQQRKRR